MALTPIDATEFTEEINRLVLEAREQINGRVANAIRRRGAASNWATMKQAEMAEIEQAVRQVMSRLDGQLAIAVNDAVTDAHNLGVKQALRELGLSVQGVLPPARLAAISAIATDIRSTIMGGMAQVLRQAPDIYQRVVSSAVSNMSLGVYTRREATQLAVDRFARDGVTSFVDRAGRTWDIGTYSEMATRTGTAKAAIQGHVDTLVANEHPLVMIIPGPRVCPVCDAWVGKVLSLHWSAQDEFPGVDVFASLDDARAAGWGHPNCRCSLGAYIPGVSNLDPDRPSDSGYKASQEQRAIERNIRHWKDRERMAVTPEAKERARAKVREWQARMRDHLDKYPDLKRLPYRESSVRPRVSMRNRVLVDEFHPGMLGQALEDVKGFTGKGAEYLQYAMQDAELHGARVLVARDAQGRVRGAMSLIDRAGEYDAENDIFTPPVKIIGYAGSVMPGAGREMLEHAMSIALEDNVPLYFEATADSDAYWKRRGAVVDPEGIGWEYYGFSREMMMKFLGLI